LTLKLVTTGPPERWSPILRRFCDSLVDDAAETYELPHFEQHWAMTSIKSIYEIRSFETGAELAKHIDKYTVAECEGELHRRVLFVCRSRNGARKHMQDGDETRG